jgi:hypothetical protein
MAVTVNVLGRAMLNMVTGRIDLDTDTFKMLLATTAANKDTADFRDDVTELAGTSGYTSGGVTLTNVTVTYDSATDQVRFDFDDPSYPFSALVRFQYPTVYKARGGAASADELVAQVDLGAEQAISTTWAMTIDVTGLFVIDVS